MSAPDAADATSEHPPGHAIVVAAWAGNVLFALTAIPASAGVDAFDTPSIAMALALFFVSIVVWLWAFAVAVARSAQGDAIVVGNMFLVEGDVPRSVRRHLFAALAVCIVIAAGTAAFEPFGVLVPMLPLGFMGLWGARHGRFPARDDVARRR